MMYYTVRTAIGILLIFPCDFNSSDLQEVGTRCELPHACELSLACVLCLSLHSLVLSPLLNLVSLFELQLDNHFIVRCYMDASKLPKQLNQPCLISLLASFFYLTIQGPAPNPLFDRVHSPNPLNGIILTSSLTTFFSWSADCSLPRVEEAILQAVTTQTDSVLFLSEWWIWSSQRVLTPHRPPLPHHPVSSLAPTSKGRHDG